jgi:hypothetical protein
MKYLMAVILLLSFICAYGLKLKYRQNTISNDSYHYLTMNSIDDGYHLTGDSDLNGVSDYILNPDFSTMKWKFTNPGKKIDLDVLRTGNTITLKGIYKGSPIERVIPVNNDPWIEQWEIGLESFIMSGEKEKTFWSVNPNDVNQVGEFTVTKKGIEAIDFNGSKTDAVWVKVTLAGILGNFFHFDFYFRQTDGRLLVEQYPDLPKGTPNKVVLMEEEN